jgi:hypothetical protein
LRDGDDALADVSSTVISEALAAGTGRVEHLVLPYRYDHLDVHLAGATEAPAQEAE